MNITITARNTSIKDSFRERIDKKLAKFDKFFGDSAKAAVTVTREGERDTVEVTIKSEGLFFRAEKSAPDREDSLEGVCDSLTRQIVKNKKKLEKRMKSVTFTPEYVSDEAEQDSYSVVRTKKFTVKPMDVEEAILQMNMLGHAFFMFRNAGTGQICVVYRRNGGDYGLIEPEEE